MEENPLNSPNPASTPGTTAPDAAPTSPAQTNPLGGESLPDPSGMDLGGPGKKKKNNSKILMIVAAVLVALVLIVVIVAIVASSSSKRNKEKAEAQNQYQSGYDAGTKDQKAASEKANLEQASMDVRIYKSAPDFGSFEIPIPKSWSLLVNPRPNDGAINGTADPDYIDQTAKLHVFTFDQKRADYDALVKEMNAKATDSRGAIVASDVTVSGISGRRYKGTFDAKNNVKAEIVILPLREKVFTFKTDDPDKYSESFNKILNSTKLNP